MIANTVLSVYNNDGDTRDLESRFHIDSVGLGFKGNQCALLHGGKCKTAISRMPSLEDTSHVEVGLGGGWGD